MTKKITYIEPTQNSGKAFFKRGITGKVVMLNLLRFRQIADYSANPQLAPNEPISGEKAYKLYMKQAAPFLKKSGGKVIFFGKGRDFFYWSERRTGGRGDVSLAKQR
jgi:hypothetical protein